MKLNCFIVGLLAIIVHAQGQSDSYLTMKDTFKGGHDVHHISVRGFLCRAVLALADEHEYQAAFTDVKNVKIITVPKTEFERRELTPNGFKKVLREDNFQELAHFRDGGDFVSIYLQENGKNKNRYFILVEEESNIVGLEIKGNVDADLLMKMNRELASNY